MSVDVAGTGEWPALPSPAAWRQLGVGDVVEVAGGHQSRVYRARLEHDGGPVAVKLTDSRFTDQNRLEGRMAVADEIASVSPCAVGPLRIGGSFVNRVGEWFAVASPFVDGPRPDVERPEHVKLMGRTLAELHRAIADVPIDGLAPVAALELARTEGDQLPVQLLHGDFSAANIRLRAGEPKIFDFDDFGTGPVHFDVANTLYMVLFDATVTEDPGRYVRFREWFVEAYRSVAGGSVDDGLLDRMIGLRRDALRYWIDHLDEAPTGIRTSSADWLATLRAFTDPAT